MNKNKEIIFFNEQAEHWRDTEKSIKIAKDFINRFDMGNNNSVLDIGAGTGVLYRILKGRSITAYLGIDIAEKMVEEFLRRHPEADVRHGDYENRYIVNKEFDFVIIYDSIPHFRELDTVFTNSYANLSENGKFLIAHSKTREALKEHHKKIGYKADRDPIPNDDHLLFLSQKHGFTNTKIEDEDYFLFVSDKDSIMK